MNIIIVLSYLLLDGVIIIVKLALNVIFRLSKAGAIAVDAPFAVSLAW